MSEVNGISGSIAVAGPLFLKALNSPTVSLIMSRLRVHLLFSTAKRSVRLRSSRNMETPDFSSISVASSQLDPPALAPTAGSLSTSGGFTNRLVKCCKSVRTVATGSNGEID